MHFRRLLYLSIILIPAVASPQLSAPNTENRVDWFSHANEQLNLRTPGAIPFHLKVKFRAFSGVELLGPAEESTFISGDGSYEETWLAPHNWRRELELAGYHAIEEDMDGVRKIQASSDYEPIRAVMLLEALLNPIPHDLTSREFPHASGWRIDQVKAGSLSLVRLSKSSGNSKADFTDSFYFLSDGSLFMRNDVGLVTLREGAFVFGGKSVPRRITIKAGDRELITAELWIEPPQANSPLVELPGSAADPGMTLRPLHMSEVRMTELPRSHSGGPPDGRNVPVFSYQAMLDRTGHYREAEVIFAPNLADGGRHLEALRKDRIKPAQIDGAPCQLIQIFTTQ